VLQQSTKGGGGVSYEFVLEVSRLHPLTVSAKALRVTLCLVFEVQQCSLCSRRGCQSQIKQGFHGKDLAFPWR
jgi:hypothetical protein